MTELNADLFDSLAEKIESLDLSSAESETLDQIFARAAALDSDDDVAGFQRTGEKELWPPRDAVVLMKSPVGQKLGLGAGMINASVLTPTEHGRV